MKKKEEKGFEFKELFTNKQYRSIIILIFYAILFTVLIVIIRNPRGNLNTSGGTTITNVDGYELIDNKNFGYKYTVLVDDEEYIYEGEKFGDKELFTLSKGEVSREYYIEKDNIYVKEKDIYQRAMEKPIIVFDFFNTDILDQLITRGILVDEEAKRYRIDSQNLYDVLNDDTVKVETSENYITLNYRNSNITRIVFELDNYAKIIGENYDKVIISLDYYDFNLIEDFNVKTVE